MPWRDRFKSARRMATVHLLLSALVAATAAWLVFRVWYPFPYDEVTGGRQLFSLLIAVDVVCGPLLTLILFSPTKPIAKWRVDVALIATVQLGALIFGLSQVAAARPVFLAFEGNRFRVVQAADIDVTRLPEAAPDFRQLGYSGPRLIGARLSQPTDPDYTASVRLSVQGLHPAFRPSRWVPYAHQRDAVRAELKPMAVLRKKNPSRSALINQAIRETGLDEAHLGYLPMVTADVTDWVVLVGRSDVEPKAYLHLDGW
jgi:hypothetical protein